MDTGSDDRRRPRPTGHFLISRAGHKPCDMIKAVIFDLFGTLVDISESSQPFRELTRKLNIDKERAFHLAMTTNSPTLQHFAIQLGVDPPDEIEALQAKLDQKVQSVRLFDDTLSALQDVKSSGLKTALISNLASPYKPPFFELGLDQLIDEVVFSCDCGYAKPQEEIYRLSLQQLDLSPDQAVMVGDSYDCDVVGPEAIGIKALHLVRNEFKSTAINSISTLHDVLKYIN